MSKEIIEGNKLIAEFMGITRGIDNYYNGMTDDKGSNEFPCWVYPDGKKFTHLYYHSSWDWLMPVVEKIEKLTTEDGRGEVNYIVSIEDCSCIVSQGGEGEICLSQLDSKIESTWDCVIRFIQFYNQQNT